ncbi:hypothetical protein HDU91_003944, partial [Kappamyces sp. JEL0680]
MKVSTVLCFTLAAASFKPITGYKYDARYGAPLQDYADDYAEPYEDAPVFDADQTFASDQTFEPEEGNAASFNKETFTQYAESSASDDGPA